MYIKEIDREIDEIVNNIVLNHKYNKNYFNYWKNNIINFIKNGNNEIEESILFSIVKNIHWYNDECYSFIYNSLLELLERYDNIYYVLKQRLDSSNHKFASRLLCDKIIKPNNNITLSERRGDRDINYELENVTLSNSSCIVLFDDFSGSGSMLMKVIDQIEKTYNNIDVFIINYIWTSSSLNIVRSYIKDKKNNYTVYNDNEICIEESFEIIFNSSPEIIEYISKICELCINSNYKFGFKNSGTMIAIDCLAPNNDISMIWLDCFDKVDWNNLLTRNIDYVRFQKDKNKQAKKYNLKEAYELSNISTKVNYEEYRFLFLLFNSRIINKLEIKELLGLDSVEDVEFYIEKFTKNDIIEYDGKFLTFKDENVITKFKNIYHQIGADTFKNYSKRENNNVGIIK